MEKKFILFIQYIIDYTLTRKDQRRGAQRRKENLKTKTTRTYVLIYAPLTF